MNRLEELLDKSSQLVLPAIEESVSVAAYVESLPNHSMVYMDRITLLRGKIEEHYQTRAERFCGSDVCMG